MAKNKSPNTRKDTSAKAVSLTRPRKSKKADTQGVYKTIPYDSLEELAFLQWASELQKHGYIEHIERAQSFLLSNSLQHNYVMSLKTKSKPMVQTLLHGHSYTPEFAITWARKAEGIFTCSLENTVDNPVKNFFIGNYTDSKSILTIVEIKPMWDQNNMERLFKVNQKWMWEKHQVFVNLVKPQKLFQATFTPAEYRTTPTGRVRILKWTPIYLTEFLSNIKN